MFVSHRFLKRHSVSDVIFVETEIKKKKVVVSECGCFISQTTIVVSVSISISISISMLTFRNKNAVELAEDRRDCP